MQSLNMVKAQFNGQIVEYKNQAEAGITQCRVCVLYYKMINDFWLSPLTVVY